MRIFVDMDGVIADFQHAVEEYKKDNNIPACKKLHRPELKIDFTKIPVMPGAIEALHKLRTDGHDIFIATTPSWDRPETWGHKRDWIVEHFPWLKRKMFLTHRKDLLDGDILIDDTRFRGQPNFKGTWIWFGVGNGCKDWKEVLEFINEKFDNEEI
tara:strand:+ start:2494 stop:2961 length:468 start_codon:yes stop_codon:yes gene_type:complete